MKRTGSGILFGFFVIALGLFTSGCPLDCPGRFVIENPSVGVTGDSLHAGYGCICAGTGVYLPHALLAKGVDNYHVASYAVGGDRITEEIPLQYEPLMTAYPNVEILLVNGGANDLRYAESRGLLDAGMIQDIAQAMLDHLTVIDSDGKTAVVFTIPQLISIPLGMNQENMDNMNAAILELNAEYSNQAAAFGFPVFALDAMMDENPQVYYFDSIHLTCAAYEEMAGRMADLLEPLL